MWWAGNTYPVALEKRALNRRHLVAEPNLVRQ
jgi:hypothetical protein